jgi:hypothetical protein
MPDRRKHVPTAFISDEHYALLIENLWNLTESIGRLHKAVCDACSTSEMAVWPNFTIKYEFILRSDLSEFACQVKTANPARRRLIDARYLVLRDHILKLQRARAMHDRLRH